MKYFIEKPCLPTSVTLPEPGAVARFVAMKYFVDSNLWYCITTIFMCNSIVKTIRSINCLVTLSLLYVIFANNPHFPRDCLRARLQSQSCQARLRHSVTLLTVECSEAPCPVLLGFGTDVCRIPSVLVAVHPIRDASAFRSTRLDPVAEAGYPVDC